MIWPIEIALTASPRGTARSRGRRARRARPRARMPRLPTSDPVEEVDEGDRHEQARRSDHDGGQIEHQRRLPSGLVPPCVMTRTNVSRAVTTCAADAPRKRRSASVLRWARRRRRDLRRSRLRRSTICSAGLTRDEQEPRAHASGRCLLACLLAVRRLRATNLESLRTVIADGPRLADPRVGRRDECSKVASASSAAASSKRERRPPHVRCAAVVSARSAWSAASSDRAPQAPL